MQETTEALSPWEQQAGEGARAFEAFCAFRDAGPARTVTAAYRQRSGKDKAKQASGEWNGWAEQQHWRERATAWDAHLDEIARKAAEAEHAQKLKEYRERATKFGETGAKVALGLFLAVGQRLMSMTDPKVASKETVADIPLGSLPAFLRAAAAVAQISLAVEAESLGVRELESLLVSDKDPEKDPV